jgi:hypothetical protein
VFFKKLPLIGNSDKVKRFGFSLLFMGMGAVIDRMLLYKFYEKDIFKIYKKN